MTESTESGLKDRNQLLRELIQQMIHLSLGIPGKICGRDFFQWTSPPFELRNLVQLAAIHHRFQLLRSTNNESAQL